MLTFNIADIIDSVIVSNELCDQNVIDEESIMFEAFEKALLKKSSN